MEIGKLITEGPKLVEDLISLEKIAQTTVTDPATLALITDIKTRASDIFGTIPTTEVAK